MKSNILISLLFLTNFSFFLMMRAPKEYIPINIIQSDKDLSLFKLKNAKMVLKDVKNGGSRGQNEIVMYDPDTFSQTNEWGYEAQINENFEVISLDRNVKMIENGFILSGHSEGGNEIKNNIKV